MDKLLASVIVLSYKKFNNLRKNIESIFDQDYPCIEIIFSDDGSPNYDEALVNEILSRRGDNIVNIVIVHNAENVGTVRNYNNAVDLASGEYIIPLSADDRFYSEDCISSIVECFEKSEANFITAKAVGENSKQVFPDVEDIKILVDGNTVELLKRIYISNFISGACFYFRKTAWIENGKFDENMKLLEDYPFILKILQKSEHISFLNKITVVYGEEGVSSHNNVHIQVINDTIKTLETLVLPNISIVRERRCARFIKRRYEVLKARNRIPGKLVIALKYVDISILKLACKMGKKDISIYHRFLKG